MSVVSIILLFGIAQGIFLTVLILHKHAALKANRLLGFLMAVNTMIVFHVFLGEIEYYEDNPRLMLLLLGAIFLVGPIHYSYARFLVHPQEKFEFREGLHYIPFSLYAIIITPQFFGGEVMFPSIFYVINWVFIVQFLAYMIATLLLLKRHLTKMKSIFSNLEKVKLLWLRNITYMATFAAFVFITENVLVLTNALNVDFSISSILNGAYVYIMGYLGMSKSEVFRQEVEKSVVTTKSEGKYKRSGLSEEKAEVYMKELVRLMEEEKLYTNKTLTLNDLSTKMAISTHHISETLNTHLQQNFFDFVNHYRVNHVITDMNNSEKKHLTLLGIALDAGFNSKSSFNTIFKNHTGSTPSEYMKGISSGSV